MNYLQISRNAIQSDSNNHNIQSKQITVNQLTRVQKYLMFLSIFFIFLIPLTSVQAIEPEQKQLVNKVFTAFKQNDRMGLSKMVSYPLFRLAPLAPINNQKEFLERYDEVFDRHLLGTITTSDINTDWDSIGWKGVILANGIVALDPEGNITDINYHSAREQSLVNQLTATGRVAKGRRAAHRSELNQNKALVELTTKRFHIRVDKIGNSGLRYTSWAVDRAMTDKPDLILSNGQMINSNGRNQRYIFDNGSYSYQLSIDQSGLNAKTSGSLQVFKGGQAWMREEATKVVRR